MQLKSRSPLCYKHAGRRSRYLATKILKFSVAGKRSGNSLYENECVPDPEAGDALKKDEKIGDVVETQVSNSDASVMPLTTSHVL